MAKQAKCKKCKIRFTWLREWALRRSICPVCGEQLMGTTHVLKWPVRDLGKIKPKGLQKRLYESGDGSASLWDWEKDRLTVVPWKKIIKKELTGEENDDNIK